MIRSETAFQLIVEMLPWEIPTADFIVAVIEMIALPRKFGVWRR